jgi:hypothetical protein
VRIDWYNTDFNGDGLLRIDPGWDGKIEAYVQGPMIANAALRVAGWNIFVPRMPWQAAITTSSRSPVSPFSGISSSIKFKGREAVVRCDPEAVVVAVSRLHESRR